MTIEKGQIAALAVTPGSAPNRIWLQWDGDQEPDYYSEHSGVTWAAHQIFKHDVEESKRVRF